MADRVRYVNPQSVGGDGTTPNLTGSTAAYASLATAFSTEETADNDLTGEGLLVLNCAGGEDDVGSSRVVIPAITTSATEYIYVVGDGTYSIRSSHRFSALLSQASSAAHWRFENIPIVWDGTPLTGDGVACVQLNKGFVSGAFQDLIDCRIGVDVSNFSDTPSSLSGVAIGSGGNRILLVNCEIVNVNYNDSMGDAVTHGSGAVDVETYLYGVTCYGCYNGPNAVSSGSITAKNVGVAAGINAGFVGTFDSNSTDNASFAADAPGSNPENSVTPSFVNAPSDLQLSSGDTAWAGKGADLSSDSIWNVTVDKGGNARPGTPAIGAWEPAGGGGGPSVVLMRRARGY